MPALPDAGPVLYPTDFSEGSRAAFPYAVYLAALLEVDLHALHVRGADREDEGADGREAPFPEPDEVADRVRSWLDPTGAGGDGSALPSLRSELTRGEPVPDRILAHADETGAGMICMGTHGRRGLGRLVLGSVTERVIRRSRRPVLAVRRGIPGWTEEGPGRVLAAVDLSPMTRSTLGWAAPLAADADAELVAVHVVRSPAGAAAAGKRQRIHLVHSEFDLPDVPFDAEVVPGDPAARLASMADEEDFDLIVAATHGRSGPARLVLGSVAEALVRRAPCPVLVVSAPPPGSAPADG